MTSAFEKLCGPGKPLKVEPPDAKEFIAPWMSMAAPARERAMQCAQTEDRQQCCEFEVIQLSLKNLLTFPWIAERVAAGKLRLHGAWFEIRTGVLMTLQPGGSFVRADDGLGFTATATTQPS